MKLRGKKQNSLIVLHEPNSSDPNTFKKNKKKCKKLHNREISQLESNLSSHENSKLDNEKESRYKPKLRNIDINYPGKYKKMNSGKYLYKMKKPEKRPILTKKKTYKYFDLTTVKVMMNFFNKLCDIEFENINSVKKKRVKKIDPITLKLLSDDTLNSNLNLKNNFIEHNLNNNSIYHYNKSINIKSKCDKPDLPISSNIYYKLIYPNNNANDFNKPNQPQNLKKNLYPTTRIDSNTNEKSLAEICSNMINPNNLERNNPTYMEFNHQPQKEIIKKNTYNHIVAANFIKNSQEEYLKNQSTKTSNINNNFYNSVSTNYIKPNDLTAIKQSSVFRETLTSKNSTESEKSEEKLNFPMNALDQNNLKQSNGLLKSSFQCNVEDLTNIQLGQIKEIFSRKEKETILTSRKNSEKQ